jgi:class 3 adenylate cyclase
MSYPFEDEVLALTEATRVAKTAGTAFQVNALLDEQHGRAKTDLQTPVEIIETDTFPSIDDLYSEVRKWYRMRNVVAVSVDLKNSTALSVKDRYAQTSARLYEAATGSAVRLVTKFAPQFIDIQGDGLFALFHGERAFERAFCAGTTIKTFSELSLEPLIEQSFAKEFPDTGFKVGMASGVLVAKKVGVRGTNEPAWAGKPVNYAVKCGSKADRHELIATSSVYDKLADNDYVTHSCGCSNGGIPTPLWTDTQVKKLGKHSSCKVLRTRWCGIHGNEFCAAILEGKRHRDEVSGQLAA